MHYQDHQAVGTFMILNPKEAQASSGYYKVDAITLGIKDDLATQIVTVSLIN